MDTELSRIDSHKHQQINQILAAENLRLIRRDEERKIEINFLSRLLDHMDALVVVLDHQGNIVRFNQACQRLFGYSARQVRSKLATGALPLPENSLALDRLLETLRGAAHSQQPYETDWLTNSGEKRTIAWTISAYQEDGVLQYVFATGIDITERKHTEILLENERALLRSLIDSIPDLIFYKNLDGTYRGCNRAFKGFNGHNDEEIIGSTDMDLYKPEHATAFMQTDQQVMLTGQSLSYVNWVNKPQGQPVLIETLKTPYYAPDGSLLGVIGVGRNITHHHEIQNELRKAKLEIEQLISSLSSILIVISTDNSITHWNPMAEKVFGVKAETAIKKNLAHLPLSWNMQQISLAIADCSKQLQPVYLDPMRYKRADGKEAYLGISISPLRIQTNQITGYILLAADITERRILENRLSQALKLESIGQLAAGIAHEINTPIQYVWDNTLFLQENYASLLHLVEQNQALLAAARSGSLTPQQAAAVQEEMEQLDLPFLEREVPLAIEQTLAGLQRVSEIIRAMKEFSHPGVKEKSPVDINKALQDTLTVTRNEWKYVAEVALNLDPALPKAMCLAAEINQVFLNLIVNAAQAIEEKTQADKNHPGLITISTQLDGAWIEIRIQDNGSGIPPEIQGRIFEPFFTTKDVGKGTGQGLAIAYDVVERKHSGSLTFETCVGQGTTFIIRLPRDARREEKIQTRILSQIRETKEL